MYRRPAFSVLLVSALIFVSHGASAAPRDAAASKKIDEAVNSLYLATQFDKAEALLKGVIEACEDRCSPGVKAKAWMYIGIVRGSGKQDIGGAQEAFSQAVALDPTVKLDDALATPAVRQAFAQVSGNPVAAAPAETGPAAAPAAKPAAAASAGAGAPGNMECTPTVKEVEAQRPIPVACTTDEPAAKVTLRYMPFGAETWQQVSMTKKGEYWQGEIPCADTGVNGKLRFYVQAKDKDGEELDNYGTKKQAAVINIVGRTDEDPPSYPGQKPPPKCMDAASCPEDMIGTPACPGTGGKQRGNKSWGTPCDSSQECDTGLLCVQGDNGRTCETAPSCDSSNDCPSGAVCKAGTCDLGDSDAAGPAGPFKKNWVGLHFGSDLAFLSGTDVCAPGSEFNCYYGGGTVFRDPIQKGSGGNLNGGLIPATLRVLVSYERIVFHNLAAEARVGFAFNGGPPAKDGTKFLPLHLELRAKYWFGHGVFSKKGVRPYIFLGGGIAQVDAKLTVSVLDTNPLLQPSQRTPQLDAYRKLGQSFVAGGGGAMYAFGANHGLVLNLNLMYMLPASGLVIEPSLGYEVGF